jgi:Adenylyl/Guanylyl and SMODS C-terminal sensor domain
MNKSDLNSKYREYVKNNLSPTQAEQTLVSRIYDEIRAAVGSNCLLIGSYARFTAGRPLHDLDILFIAGRFDPHHLSPQSVLANLHYTLGHGFNNPTAYRMTISQQSHSITVSFLEGSNEKFAVDIVPGFTSGTRNEFGDDIYWVPEIVMVGRPKRRARYEQLTKTKKSETEWWLKSDPRGYIRATTDINYRNPDFRKAAKFIKKWKHNCCAAHEDFKLKSFHVEQALFNIYSRNPGIEIADAVFEFFCTIPQAIARPQIKDRVNEAKYIDQYLNDLSSGEKQKVIEAPDFFLVKLEYISENPDIPGLLNSGIHRRANPAEQYLFDSKIPVFLEPRNPLSITGKVQPRSGGFRPFILDALGIINVDRKISFEANITGLLNYDLLKWKVKNDNSSPEPRGEITDHATRNNPESTRYKGDHFVECYAIRKGVCIARARQDVVLRSPRSAILRANLG